VMSPTTHFTALLARRRISGINKTICLINRHARRLSSFATSEHPIETVEVQCRSNGSIKLDILPPWTGPAFGKTIIYLRSGPVLKDSAAIDHDILTTLRASVNATIVQINYRDLQYPVPIHDVLAGYDWIWTRLLVNGNSSAKVGICGQLLGGSLGSMLALTESKATRGVSITAAALNNPIVDWIVSDREKLELAAVEEVEKALQVQEKPKRTRRKKKLVGTSWTHYGDSETLSTASLLSARKMLFKNADGYFDSFASPMHFFRTPGLALSIDDGDVIGTPVLARKSPRVFPPSDSRLILPAVSLTVGAQSPLLSQVEEFRDRLIRSKLRTERIDETDTRAAEIGAQLLPMIHSPSAGLWGVGKWDWQSDVERAGKWLDSHITPS
jgi:acetyl esterase/lipase